MKIIILVVLVSLLTACGNGNKSGLEGTYTNGALSLVFSHGNKVSMNIMNKKDETTYQVSGDKIIVYNPGPSGDVVFIKKDDDKVLDGGVVGKYIKN